MLKRIQLFTARWKQGYKTLSKQAVTKAYKKRKNLSKLGAALMMVGIIGNLVAIPGLNLSSAAAAPNLAGPFVDGGTKIFRVYNGTAWVPSSPSTANPQKEYNVGDTVNFRAHTKNITANTSIEDVTFKLDLGTAAEKTIVPSIQFESASPKLAAKDGLDITVANAEAGKTYKLELSSGYSMLYTPSETGTTETKTPNGNNADLTNGFTVTSELKGSEIYEILFNAKVVEVGKTPDPTDPTDPKEPVDPDQMIPLYLNRTLSGTEFPANKESSMIVRGTVRNNTEITANNVSVIDSFEPAQGALEVTPGSYYVKATAGTPTFTPRADLVAFEKATLKPGDELSYEYMVNIKSLVKDTSIYFNANLEGDNVISAGDKLQATAVDSTVVTPFTVSHQIKTVPSGPFGTSTTVKPTEQAQVEVVVTANQDFTSGYFDMPIVTAKAGQGQGTVTAPNNIQLNSQAATFANGRLAVENIKKDSRTIFTYNIATEAADKYAQDTSIFNIVDRFTIGESPRYATPGPLTLTVQKEKVVVPKKAAMTVDSKIVVRNGNQETLVDTMTAKPGDTIEYRVFVKETAGEKQIEDVRIEAINIDPRLAFTNGTTAGPVVADPGQSIGPQTFYAKVDAKEKFTVGTHNLAVQFRATSEQDSLSVTSAQDIVTIVKEDVVIPPPKVVKAATVDLQVFNLDFTQGNVLVNGKSVKTERALPQNRVKFLATVTNTGSKVWEDVKVSAIIPEELTVTGQNIVGNKLTMNVGTLGAGQTITREFEGTLKHKKAAYNFKEMVVMTDFEATTVSSNTVDVSVTAPTLDFTHTVDKTTSKRGETLEYTIKVKNTGDTAATDLKLTHVLAEGLTYKEADTGNKNVHILVTSDRERVYTIKDLAIGEERTLIVRATVNVDVEDKKVLITSAKLDYKDRVGNTYNPRTIDVTTTIAVVPEEKKEEKKDEEKKDDKGRTLGATTTPKTGAGTVSLSLLLAITMTSLTVLGFYMMRKANQLEHMKLNYVEFV